MNKLNRGAKDILKKLEIEKIPALIKRCPACKNLGLEFDAKTGRIYCLRCSFEEYVLR